MIDGSDRIETVIFAGGCFWCIEESFADLAGVLSTRSGYAGGNKENPTYEEVCDGETGHLESVEIKFDPNILSFENLLEYFWHSIDPFDDKGQFVDRGESYKTAIFYTNDLQKKEAVAAKKHYEDVFQKPIMTAIRPAAVFYPAEEYHQKYAQKNPLRYDLYKSSCGRERRLKDIWKK